MLLTIMEITPQYRERSEANEVPLLRLQAAIGLPNWLFGLAWGVGVFACLFIPGILSLPPSTYRDLSGTSLFFASTFAILTAFTKPVFRGMVDDLKALSNVVPMSEEELDCLARGLTRATRSELLTAVMIGVVAGLLHTYFMGSYRLPGMFAVTQSLGTIALWVVMVTTLSKLVMNAQVFSELGAIANPDLLRPSRHAAFGSAALRPTLFLIALMCAYAFLYIGDGKPMDNGVWIGASMCLITMVGIFVLPLGGVRARIKTRRAEIIASLDARLESLSRSDLGAVSADDLRDMDTLLDMRERVEHAPAWPLDFAVVQRILLYVVLPPLTWAAAAIVEMLVDRLVQ